MKNNDKRGGYRENARRPLLGESKRVTTSINIEEQLLDKLDVWLLKPGKPGAILSIDYLERCSDRSPITKKHGV